MAETVHQTLKARLETLAQRLEAAKKRFSDRGDLSQEHESFAQTLRERHDALRGKLDSAAHSGHTWEALKYEVELDVNALIEEFNDWEKNLDARNMKARR